MTQKSQQKSIINQVLPLKALKSNEIALKSYEYYKRTFNLIERTNIALGKKPTFKANTGSTLNFEVNRYAISSTTSQKI